jgi:hypothetical protein
MTGSPVIFNALDCNDVGLARIAMLALLDGATTIYPFKTAELVQRELNQYGLEGWELVLVNHQCNTSFSNGQNRKIYRLRNGRISVFS